MNNSFDRALTVLLLASLTALVAVSSAAYQLHTPPEVHQKYVATIDHMNHANVRLNEQVAASQMGLVLHFDGLVRSWDSVRATEQLLAALPSHVGPEKRHEQALAALHAVLREKEVLIEGFKTDRAVLRNAQRSLPRATARLSEFLDQQGSDSLLTTLNLVLLQALHPSKAGEQAARCGLEALSPSPVAPVACSTKPLELQGESRRQAEAVHSMADVILTRSERVDRWVRDITATPVEARVEAIRAAYSDAHNEAVISASRRRVLAQALALVSILLGATLLVRRAQAHTRVLRETQQQLREAISSVREERDLQAELAALKSRFLAMSSHEFRTPLSVILSSAELLSAYGERWDVERRQKHLTRIEGASRVMSDMVDRLLVIGRADADLLHPSPESLRLDELAMDVVDEVLSGFPNRDIEVRAGPISAFLDRKLVRHILTNLLTNALKYSPTHTTPVLILAEESSALRIEVSDEGIGIPESDQERIFEPFHRAANAPDASGTGLGLAIVKGALEAQGGTMYLTSGENGGSTFRLRLPREESRATA